MRRILLSAICLSAISTAACAFAPLGAHFSKIRKSTHLQVLPNPAEFGDLSSLQHFAHDFFATSSMVLSDAVDATKTVAKDPSWWDNYLRLFRNILVTVHSTVDGPLKSMGIENTWGISIALFTASK